MNTQKITLPIEYWNSGRTRPIKERDENGRDIEVLISFQFSLLDFQSIIHNH
jgi:hypothetical protein